MGMPMVNKSNDWIVVFRIKFDAVVDALSRPFTPDPTIDVWRFGPEDVELDEFGLPIFTAQSWGGVAVLSDEADARQFATDPLSMFTQEINAIETWSALLQPVRHRGAVNWRGDVESNSAIDVSAEKFDGPIAVMTSAGFASQTPEDLPRIKQFTTGSQRVLHQFKQNPSLLAGAIFYSMFDGLDGITFTLWSNLSTMQSAAYEHGLHGEFYRQHREQPMADRISNTRASILLSQGSWNSEDPLEKNR